MHRSSPFCVSATDSSTTNFKPKKLRMMFCCDTKGGRVTGRSAAALETNRMLDIAKRIIDKYRV
ncbi:hypothetical protein EEL51_12485 [Muribaculaceae bacterium Isolate-110 (HZI)]|nr:hypothetical protein EEL51_12485 [Muribaculaceae bacterium Isolate-110 (HZI)]